MEPKSYFWIQHSCKCTSLQGTCRYELLAAGAARQPHNNWCLWAYTLYASCIQGIVSPGISELNPCHASCIQGVVNPGEYFSHSGVKYLRVPASKDRSVRTAPGCCYVSSLHESSNGWVVALTKLLLDL